MRLGFIDHPGICPGCGELARLHELCYILEEYSLS